MNDSINPDKAVNGINRIKNTETKRLASICKDCQFNDNGYCKLIGKFCTNAIKICYKRRG